MSITAIPRMQLTEFPCPPKPRKFLFFRWMAETHNWLTIKEWWEPIYYATLCWKRQQCSKCNSIRDQYYEAQGP